MSPRRKLSQAPATSTPAGPHVIIPTAIYSLAQAQVALGLKRGSLPREIKTGRLIVRKRCGRYFIPGESLLAWINSGTYRPPGCKAPDGEAA